MIEQIPLIVSLASDLYVALHSKPIREQFPATKIWEHEWMHEGTPFRVRLNGTGDENDGIEPFGLHIFGNGWPVFVGNPAGGCVAMTTEDELVDALQWCIASVTAAAPEPAV